MITKFKQHTIGKWYRGSSSVPKLMYGEDNIFPNVAPQAEYDVIATDITSYTGNAPRVYVLDVQKWYMRTIGGNYTEYGIIATGKPQDPYVGELAVEDNHEYEYTDSGWSDLGALTRQSRLPQGYTELDYIDNIGSTDTDRVAAIDTGVVIDGKSKISLKMQTLFNTDFGRLCGCGKYNATGGFALNYEVGSTSTMRISWLNASSWSVSSVYGDYNAHEYVIDGNVAYRDGVQVLSTSAHNTQATDTMTIFTYKDEGKYGGAAYGETGYNQNRWCKGRLYYFNIEDGNGVKLCELHPAKRDSDGVVGVVDLVTSAFTSSVNAYPLYDGTVYSGGTIVYPMEYTPIPAPVTN